MSDTDSLLSCCFLYTKMNLFEYISSKGRPFVFKGLAYLARASKKLISFHTLDLFTGQAYVDRASWSWLHVFKQQSFTPFTPGMSSKAGSMSSKIDKLEGVKLIENIKTCTQSSYLSINNCFSYKALLNKTRIYSIIKKDYIVWSFG